MYRFRFLIAGGSIALFLCFAAQPTEAGGLLSKIRAKRGCSQPAPSCPQPAAPACEVQPACAAPACAAQPACAQPAPCQPAPVSACSAAPVCSEHNHPRARCMTADPLPPGTLRIRCKLRYNADVRCCSQAHAGHPEVIRSCEALAKKRYDYCTGKLNRCCSTSSPIGYVTGCECENPEYGCGGDYDTFYNCIYNCEYECMGQ